MLRLLHFIIIFFFSILLFADEGMWVPSDVHETGIWTIMQEKGAKLDSNLIYQPDSNSLSQAVVRLSTGCSGVFVSDSGLILTNQHCLSKIVPHLRNPDSILLNGYYANGKDLEVALPNLSIKETMQLIDVTDSILPQLASTKRFSEKQQIADSIALALENKYANSTGYIAEVQYSFSLNTFQLILSKIHNDVRLVFFPPEYINFGREADNWQWPRHAADFAVIRVYDKKKETDSLAHAFHPTYVVKPSPEPARENECAFVFGYPTHTELNLTSQGLRSFQYFTLPHTKMLYDATQQVLESHSRNDASVKEKYSGKLYSAQNNAKKYEGAEKMMKRYDPVTIKELHEQKMIQNDSSVSKLYNQLVDEEAKLAIFERMNTILLQTLTSSDLLLLTVKLRKLTSPGVNVDLQKEKLIKRSKKTLAEVSMAVEKDITTHSLAYFIKVCPEWIPKSLQNVDSSNVYKYVESVFASSALVNISSATKIIEKYKPSISASKLESDPLYILGNSLYEVYKFELENAFISQKATVDSLYHLYMRQLLKVEGHHLYPDANASLRISYGNVQGLEARDGVSHNWQTTPLGIIEKNRTDSVAYYASDKFISFLEDSVPPEQQICFITNCHTSGGNSGSPVLNHNGELIGINFDRVWQATMSDYYYSPDICRNIAVSYSYITLLLDKYFHAEALVSELHPLE